MTNQIHNILLRLCIYSMQKTIRQNAVVIISPRYRRKILRLYTYNTYTNNNTPALHSFSDGGYDAPPPVQTRHALSLQPPTTTPHQYACTTTHYDHTTTHTPTTHSIQATRMSPPATLYHSYNNIKNTYDAPCYYSTTTGTHATKHNNINTNTTTATLLNKKTATSDTTTTTYDTPYTKTSLYYYGYRYYSPEMGRWLSKDPIGISGGLNQYVFCGNNPVMFVDPFGLCEDEVYARITKADLWLRGSHPELYDGINPVFWRDDIPFAYGAFLGNWGKYSIISISEDIDSNSLMVQTIAHELMHAQIGGFWRNQLVMTHDLHVKIDDIAEAISVEYMMRLVPPEVMRKHMREWMFDHGLGPTIELMPWK